MLLTDDCVECGQTIAAGEPQLLGYVMAVHLHDDHPEAFEEMAEDARTMIDEADSVVDDYEPSMVDKMVDGLLTGRGDQ